MSAPTYTDLEREIIIIKAVKDLINEMVNYEMFEKFDRTTDMSLLFKTHTHKRLFNVLLVDMLSRPNPNHFGFPASPDSVSGATSTFLFYLQEISRKPLLNKDSSALAIPVNEFSAWLDGECIVESVWLSTIELEANIRLSRISFIKICGDLSKHSFARLSVNAERIKKLLASNGHVITIEQAYLAMPDFYEWFHNHVLGYHASAIGEFLNNIRWGLYDYLRPEFVRSYTRCPDIADYYYEFQVPETCDSQLGKDMYCDIMNWVRSEPYMPRFEVTKYLKMRY